MGLGHRRLANIKAKEHVFLSRKRTQVTQMKALWTFPQPVLSCFPQSLNWLVILQRLMGIIFKLYFTVEECEVFTSKIFPCRTEKP